MTNKNSAKEVMPDHYAEPVFPFSAHDRVRGALLAGAVGDALGAPVEFMIRPDIFRQFGSEGIGDYVLYAGRLGAITDDTQMTLFTAEGLLRAYVRGRLSGIASSGIMAASLNKKNQGSTHESQTRPVA